ncbi:MAG: sugar transferase [Caulobacteraceae bacterium]
MPRDVANEFLPAPDVGLELGAQRLRHARLKRLVDIVGALAGLLLMAPFLLVVAFCIWIESPGPVIFRQRRTGKDGRPFQIYKFRTMRVFEDGSKVVQAARHDRRITRVGSMLRRASIDEFPNLINVLKGEMSLVGPRPHALAHDQYYGASVSAYDERFRTKPGITGLAQVSGLRGETAEVRAMAARVDKDVEYIRNWSNVLDLKILLKTLSVVAFHPSAY